MRIRCFQESDRDHVVRLWDKAGVLRPWNDPNKDIDRKVREDPSLFFVGEEKKRIVASCTAGFDGHRGRLYYLAVDNSHHERNTTKPSMIPNDALIVLDDAIVAI